MEIHQQSWSKDFHFLDQSQARNFQGEWLDMENSGGEGNKKAGANIIKWWGLKQEMSVFVSWLCNVTAGRNPNLSYSEFPGCKMEVNNTS